MGAVIQAKDRKFDMGVIGLGVMGRNLALNINDRGYSVAVYNREADKLLEKFMTGPAGNRNTIAGTSRLEKLVSLLSRPRKIMLMVKAGEAVDALIRDLIPVLEANDIIIDGGNSLFTDTERRASQLAGHGILYVGAGVSGGEKGARTGPSIMPGGHREAWPEVKTVLQAIAARTTNGESCCEWVGGGGSGHYVKMVHNGIEYADMQLIAETYGIMKNGLGMSASDMHAVFRKWNKGNLNSFLIEITGDILNFKDEAGEPLLDKIQDKAGEKGTGKWAVMNAFDLGMPVTLIGEAVFARYLSALKNERIEASLIMPGACKEFRAISQDMGFDSVDFINNLEKALLASKIVSYAQGFMLMRQAALEYGWKLNLGAVAQMWQGGCIIRSAFLKNIQEAYGNNPKLENLLLDDYFAKSLKIYEPLWRKVVASATMMGIPIPAIAAGLSFFDGYRNPRLPANLIQAQRDYFGAHTYQRIDRPANESFHTDWTD